MPRSSITGIYTLPPGNPVTPLTVITTAWANPTMADIANELTNSLSRDGYGGMRAPFRIFDGSLAQPGMAFTNEVGAGIWREGTSLVHMAMVGVNLQTWTPTGVDFSVPVTVGGQPIAVGSFLPLAGGTLTGALGIQTNANNLILINQVADAATAVLSTSPSDTGFQLKVRNGVAANPGVCHVLGMNYGATLDVAAFQFWRGGGATGEIAVMIDGAEKVRFLNSNTQIQNRLTVNRATYIPQAALDVWGDAGNGVPGAIFNVDSLSGIRAVMQRKADGGGTFQFGTPGPHNLGLMSGGLEVIKIEPTNHANINIPGAIPAFGATGGLRINATNTAQSIQVGFDTNSPFGAWIQNGDSSNSGGVFYPFWINKLGGDVVIGKPGLAEVIVNYQNAGSNYYEAENQFFRTAAQATIVLMNGFGTYHELPMHWTKRAAQSGTSQVDAGDWDWANTSTQIRCNGTTLNITNPIEGEIKRVWWQSANVPAFTVQGGNFAWFNGVTPSAGPGLVSLVCVAPSAIRGSWSKQ